MPSSRRSGAPKRAYHHGELRGALIQSALDLLRSDGLEALTLRGVARAAGVSQAAPYRHFADRRALVAAVAEQGFRHLQAAMLEGMSRGSGASPQEGARDALRQVAIAYVRFAHDNPAEYRIMFGPEVARQDDLPELQQTSHSVLDFVKQGIEQLQAAGLIRTGDAGSMAAAAWASLHGLVMLSLDGQTHGVAPSLDALVQETTRMMMFGMAPRTELNAAAVR